MSSFQCQICFETCNQRLALPALSTINGDLLRSRDCGHPVCQSCMASYVTARVEEQRVFGIFCPFDGCKNELYEQDIEMLVQASVLEAKVANQLALLRKQDYTSRLAEACETMSMAGLGEQWQLRSMRLCPRCCVIIQKSSGCNSFGCICGHRFRFDEAPTLEEINAMLSHSLSQVMSKHGLDRPDSIRRVVEAYGLKGIKKYYRVLKFAEKNNTSLDLAELHEQALLGHDSALAQFEEARRLRKDAKLCDMLVAQSSISHDEAKLMVQKATDGDEAAWERIKQARSAQRTKRGQMQPLNSTEPSPSL